MGSHTSVWIVPGQIQLTRMLSAPCEIARDLVSEIMAPLDAEYACIPCNPINPLTDAIFTH